MKVLVDHGLPFGLAHGGAATQIMNTVSSLRRSGVEVEFLRWWDDTQKGDIVQYFGLPHVMYCRTAQQKGLKVVSTPLLTSSCNHPAWKKKLNGQLRQVIMKAPGLRSFSRQTDWESFALIDLFVVGLDAEASVLNLTYGVEPSRITKVPLGLSESFAGLQNASRGGEFLVTTGTITDRKRSTELARLAKRANVPILFVGKPYEESEAYWREFQSLIDDQFVRHHAHVDSELELIRLLQSARGFVIYSRHENWCLSAHEAAACGLPLLVQDQPWSRECFGDKAHYLKNVDDGRNADRLREFFDSAGSMSSPNLRSYSWEQVARQLVGIYEKVLAAD